MSKIQHYYEGNEYVTRAQILRRYNMPPSNFDRKIEKTPIPRVQDCAKFYYLLSEVIAVLGTIGA